MMVSVRTRWMQVNAPTRKAVMEQLRTLGIDISSELPIVDTEVRMMPAAQLMTMIDEEFFAEIGQHPMKVLVMHLNHLKHFGYTPEQQAGIEKFVADNITWCEIDLSSNKITMADHEECDHTVRAECWHVGGWANRYFPNENTSPLRLMCSQDI
ncbi:hypothetical protein [Actinoplanes derwentensis]|uniref:Uncharacterized protein n=1 Tax=Actinoplanes derwentensis TaxID=113562 RepID=A0A1H1V186_9ACTN|nr:hypothetical protein [Actinoplanes derwentensis]GID89827.1 hypothetical protein Ade03nite_87510 [Actinoplanes derwentensis]SDS78547.1 hypothetical protein SAMN04489716_1611 [Actinoplanes derwentensis]